MDIAAVAVDVKAQAVNRLFHYLIPASLQGMVQSGQRVVVPFGPRKIEGYVVEITDDSPLPRSRLREIWRVLDGRPLLDEAAMATARWMGSHYQGFFAESLQCFLPPGTRYGRERAAAKAKAFVFLADPENIEVLLASLSDNAHRQRAVLQYLQANGPSEAAVVQQVTGAASTTLRTLEAKAWIGREMRTAERPLSYSLEDHPPVLLNDQQQKALATAASHWQAEPDVPILLHGVTGSGKTEIYLRLIGDTLAAGRQAIVLVPEISLTPQTVGRFMARFGREVAVLHSGLSPGERFDQWWKIQRGQVSICIGARSAVFAPFSRLGLVVVDEEHESAYKQAEGTLKYHAREVAVYRARQAGAHCLLGSATPSVESYQRALRGDFKLVEMAHRVEHRAMPRCHLVDMGNEFRSGHRHMFSRTLQAKLAANLSAGHQSLVFLNRRGYSSFMLCRKCGHVVECPNCRVSLTEHRLAAGARLQCHYCGLSQAVPTHCPECLSTYLRAFGSGTQQVESALAELFPDARLVRMDADTTRRKGSHQHLLDTFRRREADILIGTQMIAKGLDFPAVTLVGVLAADLSLNFPDFRSGERTFQLLTQVSGRSGRGAHPGDVIIQCYDPAHHVLQAVLNGDYKGFFRREIAFRREAGYPPEQKFARILCSGPEAETKLHASTLAAWFHNHCPYVELIGPTAAPIARIKGRSRWHFFLRYPLNQALPTDISGRWPPAPQHVAVSIDIEPLSLL